MAVMLAWKQKMRRVLLLLSIIACAPSYNCASSATGTVQLDEVSFYKVISRFEASLVKFDVAFPYGEKHEAFVALAQDARDVDELLVAEVGVKDYGEKENEALAAKYGANKDNFPVVLLFLRGKSEPVPFDASHDFTTDALRQFVREHSGLYLSLPGCVRKLDQLAIKFMQSRKETERTNLSKETENVIKDLSEKEQVSGKIYKTIMKKVLEKGDGFVENEYQRVKKILGGKISKEKKNELNTRINILSTFQLKSDEPKVLKNEKIKNEKVDKVKPDL